MKTRNSYTVKFISADHEGSTQFGFIQTFLRVNNFHLAIVQPLSVIKRGLSFTNNHDLPRRLSKYSHGDLAVHIHKVDMTVTLPFIAMPVKNIISKCVFIQFPDDSYAYVSEFPNMNEGD